MKIKISFKNLEHTPSLDQRIQEKSEKFKKYFQGNTVVHWFCWVHNEEHWAEIKVNGPKFSFVAKGCSDNMYKSLDLALDKMERQVERQKELKRNKMHSHHFITPKYLQIQDSLRDEEEFLSRDWEDRSAS